MSITTAQYIFLTFVYNFLYRCPLYPQTNYITTCDLTTNNTIYDFIVVGGGTAGCAIANRLSENPNWRVLLIEAGGPPSNMTEVPTLLLSMQGTTEAWNFKTERGNYGKGFVNERCSFPQGKMIGGSSCLNAMLTIRGLDMDYDNWVAMGNPGWGWIAMQYYFDKALAKFQISKYVPAIPTRNLIVDTANFLNIPVNPVTPSWIGYFDLNLTRSNNSRFSAAKAYIASARNRSNLCVLPYSQVAKILFQGGCDKTCCSDEDSYSCSSDDLPKAIGVQLINKRNIFVKKEVIVTAGALNSPKLLMLSGIGPREHLESLNIPVVKDLQVGQNLQDHLSYGGLFIELKQLPIEVNFTDLLQLYCPAKAGPLGEIDNIILNGFINTTNSIYPDIQLIHLTLLKKDTYFLPEYLQKLGYNRDSADHLTEINQNSTILVIMPTLLRPKSRGEVKLQSKNPHVDPLIYPRYLSDPEGQDIQTLLRGIRYVENFIAQPAFANASLVNFRNPNCKRCEFRSDAFWKCMLRNFATTLYHQSGTCKMGPSTDPAAVVDPELKVYGIRSLRVADASITPVTPSCNTQLPTLAIAEKAADMVKASYV